MADKGPKVASIYTSFHIYRNPHEAHTGEITGEEQIKAIQRFVRWHERQVHVGKRLLAQLEQDNAKQAPQENKEDLPGSGATVEPEGTQAG